jgi:exonuclease VII small subunit
MPLSSRLARRGASPRAADKSGVLSLASQAVALIRELENVDNALEDAIQKYASDLADSPDLEAEMEALYVDINAIWPEAGNFRTNIEPYVSRPDYGN